MTQLTLQDPSGETRTISLSPSATALQMGRATDMDVILRDTTLPIETATLLPSTKGYWLKSSNPDVTFYYGDLPIREGLLPFGMEIKLGETRLKLQNFDKQSSTQTHDPLQQPNQISPWLTTTESGKKLLWSVKKASQTPLSIYIAGETGTGKEVIAHLIHAWSNRASGPFIPLHCAALPLSLAESELFGHVKGAYTGASHQRTGALLKAHGGTLFLDEIGDLPMEIQVKLLRFLENGEIRPVGSDTSTKADVRLVCATHKPLKQLVEEGKFRRDLYYRLASITIEIPTLRSRPDDVEFLANRFSSEFKKTLSDEALLRLKAHDWPGNVRELRHTVERACAECSPFETLISEKAFEFLFESPTDQAQSDLEVKPAMLTLFEMEKVMLLKALKITKGNRTKAAKTLDVARSTLFDMLKRHKIMGPKASEVQWAEIEASLDESTSLLQS